MEFYRLADVLLKIIQAVISGVKMKLVGDSLSLQLPIERLGALLKTKVIVTSTIEIDCELPNSRRVPLGQRQGVILPPMCHIDRIAKNRALAQPHENCLVVAGLRIEAQSTAMRNLHGRLRENETLFGLCAIDAASREIVQDGAVVSVTGKVIKMRTDTVCIHGDTPGAVDIARGLRQALKDQGIEVAPFKRAA